MRDTIIQIKNLTKEYGSSRGIFDINLEVKCGEVYGFIGTNGSGKTTTIRNMMGFIRPDHGEVNILGMDSWKKSVDIKKYISYVPGEIAFPKLATGSAFLKSQAEYLNVSDYTYMNELISRFQLDPSANLKRMSKGMKQKTALVAALMGDKDILILDEPTTGLDPLMREVFLNLIREEKAKGKTIFMSSHIFEEIEEVCDKAAMIKDGHLFDVIDVYELRHGVEKTFYVTFANPSDKDSVMRRCGSVHCVDEKASNMLKITFPMRKTKHILSLLKDYNITSLSEEHDTLENHFKTVFEKGEKENAGRK